jgi:molecular chaperone DnaK (HSP70)
MEKRPLTEIFPSLQSARAPPGRQVRAFGIDLGTTNSVVAEATWSSAEPEVAGIRCIEIDQPTQQGLYTSALVPSVVALVDGREYVGEGAKRLVAQGPGLGLQRNRDFFYETKNDIGTSRAYHRAPEDYGDALAIGAKILGFLKRAVGQANASS